MRTLPFLHACPRQSKLDGMEGIWKEREGMGGNRRESEGGFGTRESRDRIEKGENEGEKRVNGNENGMSGRERKTQRTGRVTFVVVCQNDGSLALGTWS